VIARRPKPGRARRVMIAAHAPRFSIRFNREP
jgi:hypothetical protein